MSQVASTGNPNFTVPINATNTTLSADGSLDLDGWIYNNGVMKKQLYSSENGFSLTTGQEVYSYEEAYAYLANPQHADPNRQSKLQTGNIVITSSGRVFIEVDEILEECKTDVRVDSEIPIQEKDGKWIMTKTTKYGIFDSKNNPSISILTFFDIGLNRVMFMVLDGQR